MCVHQPEFLRKYNTSTFTNKFLDCNIAFTTVTELPVVFVLTDFALTSGWSGENAKKCLTVHRAQSCRFGVQERNEHE